MTQNVGQLLQAVNPALRIPGPQAGELSGGALDRYLPEIFAPSPLKDSLSLSERAQSILAERDRVFDTIQKGLEELQETDINLARQRLQAVNERLVLTRTLLNNAGTDDQRDTILRGAQEIGRELKNIGSQIGQIIGDSSFSSSLTSSFSNISSIRGISSAQSLSVDFSFFEVSATETSLSITQGEEGLTVEASVTQTELVVSSLNVESVSGLGFGRESLPPPGGDVIRELLRAFQEAGKGFDALGRGILASYDEQESSGLSKFLQLLEEISESGAGLFAGLGPLQDASLISIDA